jgi:hypothetical protein
MDSDEPIIYRVGMFFYVIGGGAFILFVVSDFAKQADFDYFFMSLLMFGVGRILRRSKPGPPSAGRFAWWRKTREEARNKKQGAKKK